MYLPAKMFSYVDARKELEELEKEIYDSDDEVLVDECRAVTVGRNIVVDKVIRNFDLFGTPLKRKERRMLINYYVLTHCEEVLEI